MTEDREEAEQVGLFGADEDFHRVWSEWKGMPEFVHEDLEPYSSVLVHFASAADRAAFEALVDQKLPLSSKRLSAIWYPKMGLGGYTDKRYRAVESETVVEPIAEAIPVESPASSILDLLPPPYVPEESSAVTVTAGDMVHPGVRMLIHHTVAPDHYEDESCTAEPAVRSGYCHD